MRLNKKGFTLIELLAVVVILLAISVIAISSISAAMERNKVKQDNAKIDLIISYARVYYDAHKNTEDSCIELDDLQLSDVESVDSNGDAFEGVVIHNDGGDFEFVKNYSSCDDYLAG